MTREPVTLEIRLHNVAFHIESYPTLATEIGQFSDLQWIHENLSDSSHPPMTSHPPELGSLTQYGGLNSNGGLIPSGGVVALHRDAAIYQTLTNQRGLFTQPAPCFSMHATSVSTLRKPSDPHLIYDSDLQVFYQISTQPSTTPESTSDPTLSSPEKTIPKIIVFANENQHSARIAILRIVRELASQKMLSLGWLPLHASAVAFAQGSILVLGERRAGKSTLMLQLLTLPACNFLANDRVCIDVFAPNGPQAYSIPCVINLRASTLELLNKHSASSDMANHLCDPICRSWRARETLEETMTKSHTAHENIPPTDLTLSPSQFLHLVQRNKIPSARARVLLFPSIREEQGCCIRRLTPNECLSYLHSNLFPITPSIFLNSSRADTIPHTATAQAATTQDTDFQIPLMQLANSVRGYAIEIERGKLLSKEDLSSLVMASLD
jgi:hypothetical protein